MCTVCVCVWLLPFVMVMTQRGRNFSLVVVVLLRAHARRSLDVLRCCKYKMYISLFSKFLKKYFILKILQKLYLFSFKVFFCLSERYFSNIFKTIPQHQKLAQAINNEFFYICICWFYSSFFLLTTGIFRNDVALPPSSPPHKVNVIFNAIVCVCSWSPAIASLIVIVYIFAY